MNVVFNGALMVMAKRPSPGKTKTRLTPALSPKGAAELYECFLLDSLAVAREQETVDHYIAYHPANSDDYFRLLAPDFGIVQQRGNSLAERLNHVLNSGFNAGYGRVVAMNSDSPNLPAEYVTRAFDLLGEVDMVLGPSEDGGYYLIGLKQPQPDLILPVVMSTPSVLEETFGLAETAGDQISLLPSWYDVDSIADLTRLKAELMQAPHGVAPYTRRFLSDKVLHEQRSGD